MQTISDIQLQSVKIALKEPFVISLGPLYHAESVFVKITTTDGLVGFGECSPFMSINGESAATCMIVGEYFKQGLLGANALDIAACVQHMDAIIYGNTSIKSAFDMALYDIAAQAANLPLYQFLGGENNKPIATDYTVSVGNAAAMAVAAKKIVDHGFPVIKVKLGKGGAEDIVRMQAIREAVGMEIPIRIDANQGWQVDEAIVTLKTLESLNIQHCEEPINRKLFMHLPKIKQATSIPLMADESCCDVYDAERLIALNAVDRFNIKLGKCGGIYHALKIIRIAEQHQIPIQIGAFLESRLAMTAFAHLALCSDAIQFYDFDTALMFSSDPVIDGIVYSDKGKIDVRETNGIAATIVF